MWAAASTLQAVFGVTYETSSEARQLFLGAISKIGFLLPGLTIDDLRGEWYFGGFLTDLKVLSAALMKNGL